MPLLKLLIKIEMLLIICCASRYSASHGTYHENMQSSGESEVHLVLNHFFNFMLTVPNTFVGFNVREIKCCYVIHNAFFIIHVSLGSHFSKKHEVSANFLSPFRHGGRVCKILLLGSLLAQLVAKFIRLYQLSEVCIVDRHFKFLDIVARLNVLARFIFD